MNHAEKLALLTEWHADTLALQKRWDEFKALTLAPADSPLGNAIWMAAEGYTTQVAACIGDDGGWLDWWHYECKLGAKPMEARIKSGSRWRKVLVNSPKSLLKAIELSQSKEPQ